LLPLCAASVCCILFAASVCCLCLCAHVVSECRHAGCAVCCCLRCVVYAARPPLVPYTSLADALHVSAPHATSPAVAAPASAAFAAGCRPCGSAIPLLGRGGGCRIVPSAGAA
ncbi:hypothetical protein BC831DRAFT_471565, partial [Entophlyctis helioformis]